MALENKRFGIIPVASELNVISIENVMSGYLNTLKNIGGQVLTVDSISDPSPLFIFVASGGTEQKVYRLWLERKKEFQNEPIILLAHPGNNSLPASLEFLARVHQEGAKGKIIFLDESFNRDCWNELEMTIKHYNVYHKLKNTKIGLIGEPSDWLIASMPESEIIKNIWGPQIVKIDLEELKISEIKDDEIDNDHYSFVINAAEIKEPSKKELKKVVRVYAALKQIIKKYELDAVSLRCFDLVLDLKTTGCFALSKLNDDGIIAGCEGDLVSTVGMIWANYLTDQSVWMANPAQIDEQNNSILLAHCTVPIGMVSNYKLRSHFESGLGVGIQGELTKGKSTVFRLGGKNLEKIWISNAEIMQTFPADNLCRTQVGVKLHGSLKASDLLTAPLGNHLLLLRGSYAKELLNWWETFID